MGHSAISKTAAPPFLEPGFVSRFAEWAAGIALAVMLTACGGGDSSSGGGGDAGEAAGGAGGPAPAAGGGNPGNRFAGRYAGIGTITLNAPGLPPESVTGSITFVIDSRGNVTSDPGIPQSGTGRLNGNSFTVTVPGSRFNEPGLNCSGSLLIRGTVSGQTINGTFSGSGFTCNGVPVQLSGTYSATRTGPAQRAAAEESVMDGMKEWLSPAR